MIPKVLAYITREGKHGKEILAFRHQHHPEAGVQVPGGTVEHGEDLVAALRREVEEETSLTDLKLIGQIAPDRLLWTVALHGGVSRKQTMSQSEIVVRPATENDVAEISNLLRELGYPLEVALVKENLALLSSTSVVSQNVKHENQKHSPT